MTFCAASSSRQNGKHSRSMRHDAATEGAPTRKATCRAGSNIAFIKYWGVADPALNIPLNNSISMTLAGAHTTTTVAWDDSARLAADSITIDGVELQDAPAARIVAHLDRLRGLAGVNYKRACRQQQQLSHGLRHRQLGQRIRRAHGRGDRPPWA